MVCTPLINSFSLRTDPTPTEVALCATLKVRNIGKLKLTLPTIITFIQRNWCKTCYLFSQQMMLVLLQTQKENVLYKTHSYLNDSGNWGKSFVVLFFTQHYWSIWFSASPNIYKQSLWFNGKPVKAITITFPWFR